MTDGEQRERFARLETLMEGVGSTLEKFLDRYERDEKSTNGRIDTLQQGIMQNDKRLEIIEFDIKDSQIEIEEIKTSQEKLDHDTRATAEHQDEKIRELQQAPANAALDAKVSTKKELRAAIIGAGVTAAVGVAVAVGGKLISK